MSSDEFDLNEFVNTDLDGGDQNEGSQLRKLLKQAQAALKATTGELQSLKDQQVTATLAKTWTDLGVPESIQGFYTGEKTADAITKWWESSKGFFNIPEPEGQEQQQEQKQQEQQLTPEQQQMQALQQLANQGGDRPANGSAPAVQQKTTEFLRTSPRTNPNGLDQYLTDLGLPTNGIDVSQAL